ncbi:hypothetical protein F4604DRAFT_1677465 [Suillus subluteus]|nr:hypothetical protein F4604DRAFT_1677465 [Suillus subluteus]
METPSSPSSTITAPPNYHETTLMFAKLTTEAMTCDFALLHYDSMSKSMIEWCCYFQLPSSSAIVLLMDYPEEREKLCSIRLEWTRREQTELMAKLNSSIGDGIMETEFHILFRYCKRVGVRPMMNCHILVCSGGVQKRQLKQLESLLMKRRYISGAAPFDNCNAP